MTVTDEKDQEKFVYKRADRSKRNSPWRRTVRRFRRWVLMPVVRFVGTTLLKVYSRLWRVAVISDDPAEVERFKKEGCLGVAWHGRALAALPVFRDVDASVLVSQSGDGQMIGYLLQGFGFGVIPGSRSRGGAKAMRQMIATLKEGQTIVITPDGPRGPFHSITQGVAFLAQKTGYPVVPVGLACSRAWHSSSWDNFTIPKPFARVVAFVGAPISVGKDVASADLEEYTERIRASLIDAEKRAAAHLGQEPDW